jgi:glycosyltransferase involved in cell wall biosynthesis
MPIARRRVGFLVEGLGRSGGMNVVRRYAEYLGAHEAWESALIVTGRDTDGLPARDGNVPVIDLRDARGHWDVLLATWWTTTEALWALPAERRVLFMQGIEQRFYREEDWPDRLGAMTVLDLPVDYIVVAEYMVALMRELRPDAEVVLVPNGIDKETFVPSGTRDDSQPLRVLVEGQPTLWFKGIDAALRSVRRMQQPATVTLAAHDLDDAEEAALEVTPDRIVSEQIGAGMAELYREHDVLLKLSRFEGFGLPVLEALHTGTPVITTPYTGHDALVDDWVNGLVVDFDDQAGTAAALDLLAGDRDLLARLGTGAVESMRGWPSSDDTAERFEAALERLLERGPAPPDAALDGLMKRRLATTALAREAFRRERAYRHEYEQMKRSAAHERSVAEERLAELQSIKAERAYRAATALRRAIDSIRPRR